MKPDYNRPRGATTTPNKQPWRTQAACQNYPDTFEAADHELNTKTWNSKRHLAPNIQDAIALCHTCPVVDACLQFAMSTEEGTHGRWSVWGGLTPKQRRQLANTTRKANAA